MSRNRVLWIVVALAVVMLSGLVAWSLHPPPPCCAAPQPTGPGVGGDFHLVDQSGQPVDQALLKRKWTAVFFGYTYCPDACPTTLQTLGAASEQLGARGKDFQV